MLSGAITGFLQMFPDLLLTDEEDRRAARSAIAGVVASALAPIDPLAPAVGSALLGQELSRELIGDQATGEDAAACFGALARILSGPSEEILARSSGALLGATTAAASGRLDVERGLSLGSRLGSSSLAELGARLGAAGAGASLSVAMAGPEDREEALSVGAELGLGVLGAFPCPRPSEAGEGLDEGRPWPALGGQAVGLLAAAVVQASSRGPPHLWASLRAGLGVAGRPEALLCALDSGSGIAVAADSTASVSALMELENERRFRAEQRREEARAAERGWKSWRPRAEIPARRSRQLSRTGAGLSSLATTLHSVDRRK